MRNAALLGSALVAIAVVGISGTASAAYHDRYYDRAAGYFTLDAQFNYGIWTGDGRTNPFGPAIGVRGGVTLDPGLYLGADFDYFFGEDRINVYDVMGEVGFDFWLHRRGVLRPKVGLGVGFLKAGDATRSGFAVAPGAQYIHFFSSAFLTFEARYQTISMDGPDPNAVVLGVGLGLAL